VLEALEGSQAIARAVAMCRPQVVAAYPITPQTHIVEGLSGLISSGTLSAQYISVESEFSAASVVMGASAAGSRSYTASAAQGILLMTEVLYNTAGLRIPTVMTVANRAVSAPLSIWNDHQDSMSVRDSGWIQLYCASNQEAVDTTIQAFFISEKTEIPVMVCVDGYTLTHTLEPVDLPAQEDVDAFLPPFRFRRTLDPGSPLTVGTLVSPDFFTEARYINHQAIENAKEIIREADDLFFGLTGRRSGALISQSGNPSGKTGVLVMGSVFGTLSDALASHDERDQIRLLKLRSFRPFPNEELREAVRGLETLIVLDRSLSPGSGGGILGMEVRSALFGQKSAPRIINAVAGLGGRDLPLSLLGSLVNLSKSPDTPEFLFADIERSRISEEIFPVKKTNHAEKSSWKNFP